MLTTVLTGLSAIAALTVALVVFSGRINVEETARKNSALDTCRLFQVTFGVAVLMQSRQLVYNRRGKVIGYVQSGGAAAQAQLGTFEKRVGIFNCQAYSLKVVRGRVAVPPPSKVLRKSIRSSKEVHP